MKEDYKLILESLDPLLFIIVSTLLSWLTLNEYFHFKSYLTSRFGNQLQYVFTIGNSCLRPINKQLLDIYDQSCNLPQTFPIKFLL